jgi:fused signal recognition particle receptor
LPRELKRIFSDLYSKIASTGRKNVDKIFSELEIELVESGLSIQFLDGIKEHIKRELAGKDRVSEDFLRGKIREHILKKIKLEPPDLGFIIKKAKEEGRIPVFLFFGFNGVGKSLSLVKTADILIKNGFSPLIAAADTFRSAAEEQLEGYARMIRVQVVKGGRGADPAAVIYDAVQKASFKGFDVVLGDTSGRRAMDRNLGEELRRIVRITKPDLNILVVDGLAGSDVVNQCIGFSQFVPIDTVIVSKVDAGGYAAAIQASYILEKPILFLGTGTSVKDYVKFDPEKAIDEMF